MVCDRCIMAVKEILAQQEITPSRIGLGYVEVSEEVTKQQLYQVETALRAIGLEVIRERNEELVNQIMLRINELLSSDIDLQGIQLSKELVTLLNRDYKSISTLFAETEGITIEKFFIRQRIEKAKEFITYNQLSLSQIADKLGFSSVAHLSAQFKQLTGMTPTAFKTTIGHQK